MKVRSRGSGASEQDPFVVTIDGEIDSGKCDCLEKFWDFYVPDGVQYLQVLMGNVDAIDPVSVAVMVNLLRGNIAAGAQIVLEAPPQVLAHTLYKAGMLEAPAAIQIEEERTEEPYAG